MPGVRYAVAVERADLRIDVTRGDGETLLALAGELDMSTVARFSDAVNEELSRHPQRMVLDLAELTFCDSLGLGTLVVLNRTAQAQRTHMMLRNPSDSFTRMLKTTGLDAGLAVSDRDSD